MNNPSIPPSIGEGVVPVIGADRDRYVELKGWIDPHVIASVGKGWCDATAEMQALARHRLSFTPPVPDNALREALEALESHVREQIAHVETRIQDGIELGATVWRIALEDVARENRQALAALKGSAS